MSSRFGIGPYGALLYSLEADALRYRMLGTSTVAVVGNVLVITSFAPMVGSSSVAATGRLLWDRITVAPCDGWTKVGASLCGIPA